MTWYGGGMGGGARLFVSLFWLALIRSSSGAGTHVLGANYRPPANYAAAAEPSQPSPHNVRERS